MKLTKHTLESCKKSASKYETRSLWSKGDAKSYYYAQKKGWLDECCINMISLRKKHTLESCKESASKYKTRTEWKKADASSHQTARKRGWFDECCVIIDNRKKNNLKIKDKIDTNLYKHPNNKVGIYHKQPLGLDVMKAKYIAMKDISADNFFKKNYIYFEHLINMLKHCPLQYYTLDLEIY